MVRTFDPALIILDINDNQAGRGWKFLQLLKMEDTTAAIPILISTTTTSFSMEMEGSLAAQSIRILRKPFDLGTAVALIQHILMPDLPEPLFSSDLPLPILVVEDDEDLRNVMVTILRMERYLVSTTAHGQLALNAVAHARYALILLDMSMPVMNGPAFLAAYAQQPEPHSPVIIYTAGFVPLTEPLPAFVIGTLRKPFEIADLLTMVGRYAQHA